MSNTLRLQHLSRAIVGSVGKLPFVRSVTVKDSCVMIGVCVKNLLDDAKHLEVLVPAAAAAAAAADLSEPRQQ